MKVFTADAIEKGYSSPTDYHWCDNNDLLMFGQFQLDNKNQSGVSMCGISSRKYTTHILVKDINIDDVFYKELITGSIERAMNCKIDMDGNFDVNIGFIMHFNVDDIVDELLEKASCFECNKKIKCLGRTLRYN